MLYIFAAAPLHSGMTTCFDNQQFLCDDAYLTNLLLNKNFLTKLFTVSNSLLYFDSSFSFGLKVL